MAENSAIEWTDHTWTPVVGCDPISPACANCYAALMAARLEAMGMEKYAGIATRNGNRGKWTGKVTLWEPELLEPLKVRKPSTWFLTSMGDVGHEAVPFDFVDRLFAVMALCPQHTFYVLTKRPERLAGYLDDAATAIRVCCATIPFATTDALRFSNPAGTDGWWPLPNVLIGCTAEDQPRADERRPSMASIAAAGWRTFVSYEPALGPVDWSGWEFLSWLISGGESGQNARPSHPDWHRAARDWCAANGVPFLFKQWGEWSPLDGLLSEAPRHSGVHVWDGGYPGSASIRVGKKSAGRLLDGVEHNEAPKG